MSTPIKPTTSIEDLPPEMICELFKHLPPKDLIVCLMVNKRWHSIHAGFKVHSLVAIEENNDYYYLDQVHKWSYPDQKFGDHQMCDLKLFSRLADQPLLSNLKHLVLLCYKYKFNLDRLNSFSQLMHLEIFFEHSEKKVNLSLAKLLVLVCHGSDDAFFQSDLLLSIDCPKLRVLVFRGGQLDVKHPETLRVLETNMFGSKLAPFKCVECLVTRELNVISKSTLLSLPNLKALRYNEDIEKAFRRFPGEYGGLNRLDRMKQTLSEFLGHVKQLRDKDFQFTFAGFQLTKISLEEIDFGVFVEYGAEWVSNEYVYMKNYHLIDPDAVRFVRKLNYGLLMTNVVGEFPACFSQKFSGIKKVHARSTRGAVVQDARHFLWFLKSLRFLRNLDLDNTELGQEFYDHLPKVAGSLMKLEMNPYSWTGKQKPSHLDYSRHESAQLLDFSFLNGLPHLTDLSINQKLACDSVYSLLDLFGELYGVEIRFFCKFKERVNIEKWRYHNLYTAFDCTYEHDLVSQADPDNLLDFLEELQSEMSTGDEDSDYY